MLAFQLWSALYNGHQLPSPSAILNHPDCNFADVAVIIQIDGECRGRVVAIGSNLPAPVSKLPVALAAIPGRSLLSRITEHVLEPIANRAPVGFEAEFVDESGQTISYRAIALPCSNDGVAIDTILGVITHKFQADGPDEASSLILNESDGDATKATGSKHSKLGGGPDPKAFGRKSKTADSEKTIAKPAVKSAEHTTTDTAAVLSRKGTDHPPESISETRKEAIMNYKQKLKECIQIDGAIAVALFDMESGMAIATEQSSKGALDLEVAAAGNTNVLRAKYATMKELGLDEAIEDILITLESQIHMIRPATSETGQGLIVYLALDKAKANLAMARLKLRQIEKGLEV